VSARFTSPPWPWLIGFALLTACAQPGPVVRPTAPVATPAPPSASSQTDRHLAYYQAKLVAAPRHYPSLALLASAQLDKGKETGDPQWIARARASVERSLAIQPNVEAMKVGAAIASYSHRFADALRFARLARAAYPPDTAVAALEVESYLGLGDLDAAVATLTTFPADDFHAAFARGLVAVAEKRAADAATAYALAAQRAAAEHVVALQLFAIVSAAGALLDAGDAVGARSFLDRAIAIDRDDRRLRIHLAEWLEATGRGQDALASLEQLLAERPDADLHRRAFRLARGGSDTARADLHFKAARAAYQRGIDAGEAYSFEGMVLLLTEARTDLALAVALAKRNLEVKRDASARSALEIAQALLAGAGS
jgi:Tetratricopeptide repeat